MTKINRVLKFKQSEWMKKYVNFNTERNTNAANSFEKDYFKLMINSVYGKTMENVWKVICARLVNNEKAFLKYTRGPTLIAHKIFGKNYAGIHEIKPALTLKKPIYVGLIYDFHYSFIKKTLMPNCYLLTQTVLLTK